MNETRTYNAIAIEEKWQERWAERGTNLVSDERLRTAPRPFYTLMMFPYPSAEGLHIGNMYAFTGADIYGRYRRLLGEDVFEPIGFDAFGIHSENYALKVDTHPMELIPKNVANFTRQLKRIGLMLDWSHAVNTTDPAYYRWTQWIFLQLYQAGLAVKKEAPVNWCPSCMTVLANEQVITGECERCGTAVEQRFIAQWFFKITDYAERLLSNLSWIDWSESTKKAQENWVGRSEGAVIRFPLVRAKASEDRHEPATVEAERPWVEVFTTRPDTIFGATYMVLAPEHPLVERITTDDRRDAVDAYRRAAAALDLVARKKADEKEKTGVFTGGWCVNPATGEEVPVWIADYVLMEYGTGAIMAVPGHDERDFEFATKFELPIVRVVAPEGVAADAPMEEAEAGEGVLVNSEGFDGTPTGEARAKVTAWLAEKELAEARINYRLHDWCISRQRYWGPPIPILYCDACGTVPVPEADLPVELPFVEDYKPDESGISPLARVESWYRTTCPACGGEARRETDVSDTFLDSAWYFLRYPSAHRDDVAFDDELTRKWLPVDMYIGGEEHAVLHLLYSRFITMVLKDLGHLDFEEPYERFRKHGLIVKEGAKMSKSRGNVVIPDAYVERWGADTLRTYLVFMGPFQEGGDFRDLGIQGAWGFLSRLWDTVTGDLGDGAVEGDLEQKLHATIQKVSEDVAGLRYNTAIAAMMEYLNAVREGGRAARRQEVEPLVPMVAPFAPHLAEELWEALGYEGGLFGGSSARFPTLEGGVWPRFDPARATADAIELVVQVNGKVRARVAMERGLSQEAAQEAALADENVRRFVDGAQVRKVIFVPDRLINLVVG
ncbi:MAG TPA: leucine--tRNA ligase [Longimicrobiales bacterium]|nr:leucine--tRNA ligase [Longimicrobiales bacterium]